MTTTASIPPHLLRAARSFACKVVDGTMNGSHAVSELHRMACHPLNGCASLSDAIVAEHEAAIMRLLEG
jgi:hypothetical protein